MIKKKNKKLKEKNKTNTLITLNNISNKKKFDTINSIQDCTKVLISVKNKIKLKI